MPLELENVGIAVRDLDAAIAFFTDLGLSVLGQDTIEGEWADTAVGIDGNHAKIALLEAPDGSGHLELLEYIHLDAIETEPTSPTKSPCTASRLRLRPGAVSDPHRCPRFSSR
jgi:glyoxylase I family protein